jgi:hypothetical protein
MLIRDFHLAPILKLHNNTTTAMKNGNVEWMKRQIRIPMHLDS